MIFSIVAFNGLAGSGAGIPSSESPVDINSEKYQDKNILIDQIKIEKSQMTKPFQFSTQLSGTYQTSSSCSSPRQVKEDLTM